MSRTAWPICANASSACSTTATPSSVRLAPSSTTSTARAVSAWISSISREMVALACTRGLDCRVQRQQVGLAGDAGDRVDDAADLLGLARELPDHARHGGGGVANCPHRLVCRLRRGDSLLRDGPRL